MGRFDPRIRKPDGMSEEEWRRARSEAERAANGGVIGVERGVPPEVVAVAAGSVAAGEAVDVRLPEIAPGVAEA